jgi:hypothetical protein
LLPAFKSKRGILLTQKMFENRFLKESFLVAQLTFRQKKLSLLSDRVTLDFVLLCDALLCPTVWRSTLSDHVTLYIPCPTMWRSTYIPCPTMWRSLLCLTILCYTLPDNITYAILCPNVWRSTLSDHVTFSTLPGHATLSSLSSHVMFYFVRPCDALLCPIVWRSLLCPTMWCSTLSYRIRHCLIKGMIKNWNTYIFGWHENSPSEENEFWLDSCT